MTLIADIPGASAAYVGSRPVWKAPKLFPQRISMKCEAAMPALGMYLFEVPERYLKYRSCFSMKNVGSVIIEDGNTPVSPFYGICAPENDYPNHVFLLASGNSGIREYDSVAFYLKDAQPTIRRTTPSKIEDVYSKNFRMLEVAVSVDTIDDINPLYALNFVQSNEIPLIFDTRIEGKTVYFILQESDHSKWQVGTAVEVISYEPVPAS